MQNNLGRLLRSAACGVVALLGLTIIAGGQALQWEGGLSNTLAWHPAAMTAATLLSAAAILQLRLRTGATRDSRRTWHWIMQLMAVLLVIVGWLAVELHEVGEEEEEDAESATGGEAGAADAGADDGDDDAKEPHESGSLMNAHRNVGIALIALFISQALLGWLQKRLLRLSRKVAFAMRNVHLRQGRGLPIAMAVNGLLGSFMFRSSPLIRWLLLPLAMLAVTALAIKLFHAASPPTARRAGQADDAAGAYNAGRQQSAESDDRQLLTAGEDDAAVTLSDEHAEDDAV